MTIRALRTRREHDVARLGEQGVDVRCIATQLQHAVFLAHVECGCIKRQFGKVHIRFAAVGAFDRWEDHFVELVGRVVVDRQRDHRTPGIGQTHITRRHLDPVGAVPSQSTCGCIQLIGGRIPLRNFVIGARGQLHFLDHLWGRQGHDQAAAGAIKVEVLGAVAAVLDVVNTLVVRAVG